MHKKIIVVFVLLLLIIAGLPTVIGDSDEDKSTYFFIGFIKYIEFGKGKENNFSYFYIEYVYTLKFYYNENHSYIKIKKHPYACVLYFKKADIKGYIGTFFIFVRIKTKFP